LNRLPATVDELVRASGLAAGAVAATLAELEIAQLDAEGDGIYRALPPRSPSAAALLL
jgi:DprA winged helix domain